MERETHVYNGIEFTRNSLAKYLDVSPTTIEKYLEEENGNWDNVIKRILEKPIYVYRGKEYMSISALSEATGINRRTLTKSIREKFGEVKGRIEVDSIIDEYYSRQITLKYKGHIYASMYEAAEALGLSEQTLSKYLKLANNDLEEAMNLYEESHIIGIIDGIKFKNREEIANFLGVSTQTFTKYYNINNQDLQETVKEIRRNIIEQEEAKKYPWRGKNYTRSGLANAMQIPSIKTLDSLLEQYNGDTEKVYQEYQEKKIIYRGKVYETLKDCLEEYGISKSSYYREFRNTRR